MVALSIISILIFVLALFFGRKAMKERKKVYKEIVESIKKIEKSINKG